LVEGFAEQVLLPRIAAPDLDFDEHGVTVCAVHGTHFLSYVRFLRALGTPYAVITDGDPEAGDGRTGPERVQRLADALVGEGGDPKELGLFCGETTFETDLFEATEGNRSAMFDALLSFGRSDRTTARLTAAREDGSMTAEAFLGYIERLSKGRFAQRLAASTEALDAPAYAQHALQHLMSYKHARRGY
jgi:putative ATP-dependent endonuclease of OLD family